MREHKFTDETATIAVLNTLVNDMHHALGRIIDAYQLVACVAFLTALINAADRDWFGVALGVVGGLGLMWAAIQTRRRRRKYHPATRHRTRASFTDVV